MSYIVYFLTGMVICMVIFLFWGKFVEKILRAYGFLNNSFSRFLIFGPIFSSIAHVLIEGRWEKLKIIYEYYFVTEKTLISGKIINITEDKYDMPLISSEINENIGTASLSTPLTDYIVKIEKDDGEVVLIDFDIDSDSFKKMNLKVDEKVVDIPCTKKKFDKFFYFKSITRW